MLSKPDDAETVIMLAMRTKQQANPENYGRMGELGERKKEFNELVNV